MGSSSLHPSPFKTTDPMRLHLCFFIVGSVLSFTHESTSGEYVKPYSTSFWSVQPKPEAKRRRKKNKYESFSRIDEKDPLEKLVEESVEKNQIILEKKQKHQQRPPVDSSRFQLPSGVTYPTSIDPYDPLTFGYIHIGTIQNAHGVHGWVKVATTTASDDRRFQPGLVYLKPARKRAPRPKLLLKGRKVDDEMYLVELEGITEREEAQQLRGSVLYVREEQLIEDGEENTPDEYVVSELVGLEVFLHEDPSQFVGTVVGVVFAEDISSIPGFGHDYLEVSLPRGVGGTVSFKDELVLIPLVPQIVPEVDVKKAKAVFIDPPDGLLDLKYVRHEKTRIKGFLPSNSN